MNIIHAVLMALLVFLAMPVQAERLDWFRLESVYDGDTFHVDLPCQYPVLCKHLAIRVIGVDTPERRTAKCPYEKRWNHAARAFVEDVLYNAESVELTQVKRDGRFRVDAVVLIDGQDLAQMLIQNGMGVPLADDQARYMDWCKEHTN